MRPSRSNSAVAIAKPRQEHAEVVAHRRINEIETSLRRQMAFASSAVKHPVTGAGAKKFTTCHSPSSGFNFDSGLASTIQTT